MKKTLLLLTALLALSCAEKKTVALPETLAGDWNGIIDGVGLAFEIHLGDSCYAAWTARTSGSGSRR